MLAKSKRASQNNNKNRVYEENQAKFLKNAESRVELPAGTQGKALLKDNARRAPELGQ